MELRSRVLLHRFRRVTGNPDIVFWCVILSAIAGFMGVARLLLSP
jgi:hypothetical protein